MNFFKKKTIWQKAITSIFNHIGQFVPPEKIFIKKDGIALVQISNNPEKLAIHDIVTTIYEYELKKTLTVEKEPDKVIIKEI